MAAPRKRKPNKHSPIKRFYRIREDFVRIRDQMQSAMDDGMVADFYARRAIFEFLLTQMPEAKITNTVYGQTKFPALTEEAIIEGNKQVIGYVFKRYHHFEQLSKIVKIIEMLTQFEQEVLVRDAWYSGRFQPKKETELFPVNGRLNELEEQCMMSCLSATSTINSIGDLATEADQFINGLVKIEKLKELIDTTSPLCQAWILKPDVGVDTFEAEFPAVVEYAKTHIWSGDKHASVYNEHFDKINSEFLAMQEAAEASIEEYAKNLSSLNQLHAKPTNEETLAPDETLETIPA